jgi:hypothetical protein
MSHLPCDVVPAKEGPQRRWSPSCVSWMRVVGVSITRTAENPRNGGVAERNRCKTWASLPRFRDNLRIEFLRQMPAKSGSMWPAKERVGRNAPESGPIMLTLSFVVLGPYADITRFSILRQLMMSQPANPDRSQSWRRIHPRAAGRPPDPAPQRIEKLPRRLP